MGDNIKIGTNTNKDMHRTNLLLKKVSLDLLGSKPESNAAPNIRLADHTKNIGKEKIWVLVICKSIGDLKKTFFVSFA